jgi:hypothetical protein
VRLFVLLALALLGGCTLLTSFNPEGQPCDLSAAPGAQCLTHFHCANGKCVQGDYDGGK